MELPVLVILIVMNKYWYRNAIINYLSTVYIYCSKNNTFKNWVKIMYLYHKISVWNIFIYYNIYNILLYENYFLEN